MGDRWQEFIKEVVGGDENAAIENIYSTLGSKHRVNRSKIQISEVKEISQQEVSDQITIYLLKSGKDNKKRIKGEKNG